MLSGQAGGICHKPRTAHTGQAEGSAEPDSCSDALSTRPEPHFWGLSGLSL